MGEEGPKAEPLRLIPCHNWLKGLQYKESVNITKDIQISDKNSGIKHSY